MPNLRRTAAMAACVVSALVIVTPTAVAQCGQPDPAATEQVLDSLASARARAGLPAMRVNASLVRPARGHSRNMARAGSLWHDNLASWAAGRAVAQNVAYGASGDQAFNAMWNSSSHRTAMMARRYRLIGVGAARACNGEVMVTMNMATPVRRG